MTSKQLRLSERGVWLTESATAETVEAAEAAAVAPMVPLLLSG